MFVRFTPRQLKKIKEFLSTSQVRGYDIPLYNEILKAIENPIDEKPITENSPPKQKYVEPQKYVERKPVIQEIPPVKNIAIPKMPIVQEIENDDKCEELINNIIENPDVPSPEELENAGLFGTIDKRSKKQFTKNNDYL